MLFCNKKDSSLDTSAEQIGTLIGPGAVLDGPLTTKDTARIDGIVNGSVSVTGSLILGPEAKIFGAVSCLNAYVAGEITGGITAPDGRVEISDTGKVIGDVTCKGIVIDENAVFQGKCEMTNIEAATASGTPDQATAEVNNENVASESSSQESASSESTTKTEND